MLFNVWFVQDDRLLEMKYTFLFISFCAASLPSDSLEVALTTIQDAIQTDIDYDYYTSALLRRSWLHKRIPTVASKATSSKQEKPSPSTKKHDKAGEDQVKESELSAQQPKVSSGKSKSRLSSLFNVLKIDRFKEKGTENGPKQPPKQSPPIRETSNMRNSLKAEIHRMPGSTPATADLQDTEGRRKYPEIVPEADISDPIKNRPLLERPNQYSHNRAKSFPADGDNPSGSRSRATEAKVMAALWGPGYIRTHKSGPDRDLITVAPGHFKEVTVRDPKYASAQAEMVEDSKFPSHTRNAMVTARGHIVMNRMQRGFGTEIGHYDNTEMRAPNADSLFGGDSLSEETKSHTWRYQSRPGSNAVKATTIARSGMATLEAEATVRDTRESTDMVSSRNRYSNGRRSFQG